MVCCLSLLLEKYKSTKCYTAKGFPNIVNFPDFSHNQWPVVVLFFSTWSQCTWPHARTGWGMAKHAGFCLFVCFTDCHFIYFNSNNSTFIMQLILYIITLHANPRYFFSIFPTILRYSWYIALFKFKTYKVIWYTYTRVYCEMITTVRLVNTFLTSHSYHFCCYWWFCYFKSTTLQKL